MKSLEEKSENQKTIIEGIKEQINISGFFLLELQHLSSTTLNSTLRLNFERKEDGLYISFRREKNSPFAVDEAYLHYKKKNYEIKIGRIYFILSPLGLICDNYFDSYEGFQIDSTYKDFKTTFIYSRLSSTNFPHKRFFIDDDTYSCGRIEYNFREKATIGFTYLLTGISSEYAYSTDLYLRLKGREFAGEFAKYRPSLTNYIVPDFSLREAYVFGFDLINTDRLNLFIQIGNISPYFTPVASSLVYSGAEHLNFDQATKGVDFTITYKLLKEKESEKLGIFHRGCIDKREYRIRRDEVQSEIVLLWDRIANTYRNKFVVRYLKPEIKNFYDLILEFAYFEKKKEKYSKLNLKGIFRF